MPNFDKRSYSSVILIFKHLGSSIECWKCGTLDLTAGKITDPCPTKADDFGEKGECPSNGCIKMVIGNFNQLFYWPCENLIL